jgi:hypothetical protein
MTTAVATKEETALAGLSEDEQAALKADREKLGGKFPSIPMIRLANKDMEQAPEGEYFIEKRLGDQVEITPIGKDPVITILYRTFTYSYYTPELGLVAWTSDIHGFTDLDDVVLYKKVNGQVVIDFEGVYPALKRHMEAKYKQNDPVTGKAKKLLKFKTVLYVNYNGGIYKMFVSNASSAGVDHDGNPSFDKAQPNSLQAVMDGYRKQKRVSYEFSVMLGSKLVKGEKKPFYIMTFASLAQLDSGMLRQSMKLSHEVQKTIVMIDDARKAWNKREQDSESEPIHVEADVDNDEYLSKIKPEDLPF